MNDFWTNFHETTWERKPAHLGRVLSPLLDRNEVFRLGVSVGDALGRGEELPIRWCDDGKRSDILPPTAASAALLPQRTDRDLASYSARLSARYETFFFRVPMLQLFSVELWPRLVQLTRALYPRTGTPGQMAYSDAYFGRYAATPFGVHVDGASNFTFGVDGEKTLYLWEPDFYHAHMRGADPLHYQPFVDQAIKLTVRAGEAIYWPARFYHIAVPDGRFSVTVNFAYYPEESKGTWVQRAWSDLLPSDDAKLHAFHKGSPGSDLLAICRETVRRASNGGLERQLLRNVVEHTTRLGFHHPPPLRAAVEYAVGDRVVLAADACELMCVPDGAGAAIVSANGRSFIVPDQARAERLVRALESRQPVTVEHDTRAWISEMHRWCAVERYWGVEASTS